MRKTLAALLLCLTISVVSFAGVIPQPVCTGEGCPPPACAGENCPPPADPISDPQSTADAEETSEPSLADSLLSELITVALSVL